MNAAGTPIGSGTPSPSRRRAASSMAVHQLATGEGDGERPLRADELVEPGGSGSLVDRAATSSEVSGPSRRSRSATPSSVLRLAVGERAVAVRVRRGR